jgi:plasmid stabilization system protein ParE
MRERSSPSCRGAPIPTVELSRRASREIARARDWWLANRDKAPDAFDVELTKLLVELEAMPTLVGTHQRDGARRRVLLPRIRYYVYFRIVDAGTRVQILALWHASRGRPPKL